jgi:hypothetical protein
MLANGTWGESKVIVKAVPLLREMVIAPLRL